MKTQYFSHKSLLNISLSADFLEIALLRKKTRIAKKMSKPRLNKLLDHKAITMLSVHSSSKTKKPYSNPYKIVL